MLNQKLAQFMKKITQSKISKNIFSTHPKPGSLNKKIT